MPRYICVHVNPPASTPDEGKTDWLVRRYKNDRTALRFMHLHLRASNFAPGQYILSTYPPSSDIPARKVGHFYKLA